MTPKAADAMEGDPFFRIKIFFHLHVNGGTQEGKFNFIKIVFHLCINRGTQELKTFFNIPDFLHHINIRKHAYIIPHLC